jgi:hypothetical protein
MRNFSKKATAAQMLKQGNKRGPLKLKIGELPLFPFVDFQFSVQLFLLDNKEQLVCG